MRRLGLLRHAKSDWDDASLRDFDRGLNKRGRKGAALMGAHIRKHPVRWDKILASPAERVRLTLDAGALPFPVEWDERLYLADSATLMALLAERGGAGDAVLIVAHNPGLQQLILDLVAPEAEDENLAEVMEKFPTAAFAVLDLAIAEWADIAPGIASLTHLARPRDLDPELGPERVR